MVPLRMVHWTNQNWIFYGIAEKPPFGSFIFKIAWNNSIAHKVIHVLQIITMVFIPRKKWLFLELLTERIFVEPKMVLLCKAPFGNLFFRNVQDAALEPLIPLINLNIFKQTFNITSRTFSISKTSHTVHDSRTLQSKNGSW